MFACVFYKKHLVSGDTPVRLFSPGQVQISRDAAHCCSPVSMQGSQAHHGVPSEPSQGAGFRERSPQGLRNTLARVAAELWQPSPVSYPFAVTAQPVYQTWEPARCPSSSIRKAKAGLATLPIGSSPLCLFSFCPQRTWETEGTSLLTIITFSKL